MHTVFEIFPVRRDFRQALYDVDTAARCRPIAAAAAAAAIVVLVPWGLFRQRDGLWPDEQAAETSIQIIICL